MNEARDLCWNPEFANYLNYPKYIFSPWPKNSGMSVIALASFTVLFPNISPSHAPAGMDMFW